MKPDKKDIDPAAHRYGSPEYEKTLSEIEKGQGKHAADKFRDQVMGGGKPVEVTSATQLSLNSKEHTQ